MPSSQDLMIFVDNNNDTTDYLIPCACERGNNYYGLPVLEEWEIRHVSIILVLLSVYTFEF